MSNRSVFIYVATYADRADASTDYVALIDLYETKIVGTYDVAMVVRDEAGKVHVEKHEKPTQRGAWGGILVGALVGVLFPPSIVGVATVGGAAAVGGLVGGLGGHFHEGMSRGTAKELGDLLETGQAALIVIGESRSKEALDMALTRAARSIETVVDADHTRLRRELEEAEGRLGEG
jgi:uncharacterized membrane protein